MKDKKILRMVQLSFFIAVIVVLQIIASVLTRFTPLPFSLSLVFLPIVLGGAVFGVKEGAILGSSFGILTFIMCFTGIDPGGAILFANNPFVTFLLCLLKAALAGLASALVFKALSEFSFNDHIKVALASAVAPVVNTGIFLIAMFTIYKTTLYEWAGGSDIMTYAITGLVGINFLFEFISTVVLCPIIYPYLKKLLISE